MTEHVADPVEAHILAQLRGDLADDEAARTAAVARAAPELLDRHPELRQALDEGDRRRPDDARRFAAVELGPGTVEADPATTAAFARLTAEASTAAPAPTGTEGPARARRGRRLRVVEGDEGAAGGAGDDGGGPDGGPDPSTPGPPLPVRGQWCYSTGSPRWPRGVYGRERAEAPWRLLAPLPHVHHRVTYRTNRGGHVFVVSATPEGPRVVVDGEALRDGTWAQVLDLVLSDDDRVMRAASTAIRAVAASAPSPRPVAGWEGGRLELPPVELLPPGYLATAGTEDDARADWAELGALACRPGAENLALLVGAACAAPYPAALVPHLSFAAVPVGAPRAGKSTICGAAAAWWGNPDPATGIMPPMSESAVAAGEQLAALGCLPWFRDEVHAAKWKPSDWREHFMRSLNGATRRRASQTGSGRVFGAGGWWGVQFLSGNTDPTYGATDGQQARVILLGDPHQPDAATAERVAELAARSHGWPVHWQLADHLDPSRFRELAEVARAELLDGRELAGSPGTVARSLSLCVAGAAIAGGLIGAPELRAAAVRAAARALDALALEVAESAVSFGDRLLGDVWAEVEAHPAWYPRKADYAAMRRGDRDVPTARDVRGFWHQVEGRPAVSLTAERWAELRAGADYSPRQGLAELLARGLLVVDRHKGHQYPVRVDGSTMRLYTFRPRPEPDEGAGPEGDAAPAPPEPEPDPSPEPAPAAPTLPLDPPPAASAPAAGPLVAAEGPGAAAGLVLPADRPRAAERPPGGRSGRWASSTPPASVVTALPGGRLGVLHPTGDGGRWEYPDVEVAGGGLVELLEAVDRLAPPGPVTLLIDAAAHARYRLRRTLGTRAASAPPPVAFRELHQLAGWHRPRWDDPDDAPDRLPVVSWWSWVERGPRQVLVHPAGWLREGTWPRLAAADDIDTLALRCIGHREALGIDHQGSTAATAVELYRELHKVGRITPRWHLPAEDRGKLPEPAHTDGWRRELTPAELGEATHVHALDAVTCYLSAIRSARLAAGRLVHRTDARVFDPGQAGLWQLTVPEWPHPLLPPPVPVPPGRWAWVSSGLVALYAEVFHDLGLPVEALDVHDAWIGDRRDLQGQRRFPRQLGEVLADEATPADVAAAAKGMYQQLHGKLRSRNQHRVRRPDWGYAIRDEALATLLRKVYRAAGVLPLTPNDPGNRVATPVFPVAIGDVDEVFYAGGAELIAPEPFVIAERPGGFRVKSSTDIAEWRG